MSDIRFNRWLHQSGTGGVYQDFQGNVGIGTSVPQAKLHVVGDTFINTSGITTISTLSSTSIVGVNTLGVTTAYVGSINNGPLAGFRNAIINGNFDIWQRGTSFSNPASGAYTTDRWYITFDGSGATRTISREVHDIGTPQVDNTGIFYLRFNQTVAGSGATFTVITQKIESVRLSSSKTFTISFWARGTTNSLTVSNITMRQNFGDDGSPFVDTSVANSISVPGGTWTKFSYTVTLPSISGKTIGENNSYELLFFLPINTTFSFDLSQVQVEAGPVATPFERRPIGTELALCQRYYQSLLHIHEGYGIAGNNTTTTCHFKTTMRTTPTAAEVNLVSINVSALSLSDISTTGLGYKTTTSGTGQYLRASTLNISAEL